MSLFTYNIISNSISLKLDALLTNIPVGHPFIKTLYYILVPFLDKVLSYCRVKLWCIIELFSKIFFLDAKSLPKNFFLNVWFCSKFILYYMMWKVAPHELVTVEVSAKSVHFQPFSRREGSMVQHKFIFLEVH